MARIALISHHFSEQVERLAFCLHQQQHEVLVITSSQEALTKAYPFQVLCYFKKWNIKETLKFLPTFFQYLPDICHFIYEERGDEPTMAHYMLSALVQPWPSKMTATSFFHSITGQNNWRSMPFLKMCDLVTVGTRENMMYLKRNKLISEQSYLELLPAVHGPSETSAGRLFHAEELCQRLKPFILIPKGAYSTSSSFDANDPQVDAWLVELEQHFNLLFIGHEYSPGQHPHRGRHFLQEPLSEQEWQILANQSQAVGLMHDHFSMIELMEFHQLARQAQKGLIAREDQLEIFPGLCQHKKTGWVLDHNNQALTDVLIENPKLNLPKAESSEPSYNLTDFTINHLNRIYVKALESKRKHVTRHEN